MPISIPLMERGKLYFLQQNSYANAPSKQWIIPTLRYAPTLLESSLFSGENLGEGKQPFVKRPTSSK